MMVPCIARPTHALVSRELLLSNFAALRQQASHAGAELVAVIKADAYGHGAAEALATLAADGASWFAVTCMDEACALTVPTAARVLVLSGVFGDEAEELVRRGLTPVLGSVEELQRVATAAASCPSRFRVHLEVDTGMSRQGIVWNDHRELDSFVERLQRSPQITFEAVMTHFASAEDDASSQTSEQIDRLRQVLRRITNAGCAPAMIHAGNSASLCREPQRAALQTLATEHGMRLLFRPGIALYGYGAYPNDVQLAPILEWKTRVVSLRTLPPEESVSYNATFRARRPTRIALLPVGYADGYNRLLSNRGYVLIRGQRAPIAGRVTMDQTMVDVTDIADVAISDEVVLLGQQGHDRIQADNIAALTGSIPYEVLCAISARVPRMWR